MFLELIYEFWFSIQHGVIKICEKSHVKIFVTRYGVTKNFCVKI